MADMAVDGFTLDVNWVDDRYAQVRPEGWAAREYNERFTVPRGSVEYKWPYSVLIIREDDVEKWRNQGYYNARSIPKASAWRVLLSRPEGMSDSTYSAWSGRVVAEVQRYLLATEMSEIRAAGDRARTAWVAAARAQLAECQTTLDMLAEQVNAVERGDMHPADAHNIQYARVDNWTRRK